MDIRERFPNIHFPTDLYNDKINLFRWSCQRGHIEITKWLIETLANDIDDRAGNQYSFECCCFYGHIEIAKLLIETFPDIDVHVNDESAFRGSCENGHFEISKWLNESFGDIDVHVYNEDAFRSSCSNGYIEVAKWLIKLPGKKYQVDKEIIDSIIKNKWIDLLYEMIILGYDKNLLIKYCHCPDIKEKLKSFNPIIRTKRAL